MLDVVGEVSQLGLTPGQATLGCKEADTDAKPQSRWEGQECSLDTLLELM